MRLFFLAKVECDEHKQNKTKQFPPHLLHVLHLAIHELVNRAPATAVIVILLLTVPTTPTALVFSHLFSSIIIVFYHNS